MSEPGPDQAAVGMRNDVGGLRPSSPNASVIGFADAGLIGRFKAGQQIMPSIDGALVKPGVAAAQITADMASTAQPTVSSSTSGYTGASSADQRQFVAHGSTATSEQPTQVPATPTRPQPQRFYGSVTLDTTRAVRDATAVIEEVAQHLSGLLGSRVEIMMEIHAELPEGASEHIVRTVTENCRTLKFTNYGFEEGAAIGHGG